MEQIRLCCSNTVKLRNKNSITFTTTEEGLKYCSKLFKIECDFSEVRDDDYYKLRFEQAISLLMLFCHGLILKVNKFCSKVLYDRQVTNAKVRGIFLDGRVEISNSCGEREIKAFVMGLKNWIFSNTSKGVAASTVIYSVIETIKTNALS